MAWVTIRGNRYYRRSKRVGGRVVTEHIGGNDFAECLAELDGLASQVRQADLQLVRLKREADAANTADVAGIDQFLRSVFTVLARQRGYHQHRRQWRRTRGENPMTAERDQELKSLVRKLTQANRRAPLMTPDFSGIPEEDRAVLQAAANGDKAALAKAQQYLTDPKYIRQWGNPMYAARCWLVTQVSGDDVVVARATHAQMGLLQRELGYDAANTLEKIVITRIVHNWLAIAALDARACQPAASSRERTNVEKSLTQAERRLMQAVKTLAFLRDCSVAMLMARIGDATKE